MRRQRSKIGKWFDGWAGGFREDLAWEYIKYLAKFAIALLIFPFVVVVHYLTRKFDD